MPSLSRDRPTISTVLYAGSATFPGYVAGTKSLAHAGMVVGRAGFARIRVRGIAWSLGRSAGATGHRSAPAGSRARGRAAGNPGPVQFFDCTPSGSQTLAFRRREGQVKSRHATIPPRQPARAAASKLTSSGLPKYRLSVASCTIPDDITNVQEREPVGDDGRFQSTPLEPLAFQARVVQFRQTSLPTGGQTPP